MDYSVFRWPEPIIVLPHTLIVEEKAWRVLKRRSTAPVQIKGLASRTHPCESRRYTECAERIIALRQTDSYVVNHDLHVTFWADDGVLRDPVDLDAASRSLEVDAT